MHPFFRGIDWTYLARNKAAFVPTVENDEDTSYFASKPVSQHSMWRDLPAMEQPAPAAAASSGEGLEGSGSGCLTPPGGLLSSKGGRGRGSFGRAYTAGRQVRQGGLRAHRGALRQGEPLTCMGTCASRHPSCRSEKGTARSRACAAWTAQNPRRGQGGASRWGYWVAALPGGQGMW